MEHWPSGNLTPGRSPTLSYKLATPDSSTTYSPRSSLQLKARSYPHSTCWYSRTTLCKRKIQDLMKEGNKYFPQTEYLFRFVLCSNCHNRVLKASRRFCLRRKRNRCDARILNTPNLYFNTLEGLAHAKPQSMTLL